MILESEHGRHLGIVWLEYKLTRTHCTTLQAIFAEIIPLHVEFRPERLQYRVAALSKHFDFVPLGCEPPEYTVRVSGPAIDQKIEFVARKENDWGNGVRFVTPEEVPA